jgi:hypothetical protein
MKVAAALLVVLCSASPAFAQPFTLAPEGVTPTQAPASSDLSAIAYRPITGHERFVWAVEGTIGVRSLALVGTWAAGWDTLINTPEEWGQSWSGFGKRYMQREADVAISNSMEAGLGALWGEDPRYIRSARHGVWPRVRYALKAAFVAQRPDGHLAPAWGRYVANTLNNVIENAWLPPSATTAKSTTIRSIQGFLGRMGGNLWDEFAPDVWRMVARHRQAGREPKQPD